MASREVIHAAQMFTKHGQASKVSVVKEIAIGLTLGLAVGSMWKMYHWDYMKKLDDYYSALAKQEGPKIREQRAKYIVKDA